MMPKYDVVTRRSMFGGYETKCTRCGDVFEGRTPAEAERKAARHIKEDHSHVEFDSRRRDYTYGSKNLFGF